MFKRNEIINLVQYIPVDYPKTIQSALSEQLSKVKKIHSVIVYNLFEDGEHTGWEVRYNIAQDNKLNDLFAGDVVNNVSSTMVRNAYKVTERVNCFMQSNLDTIIRSRKPLIIKLAKEMQEQWTYLEMEDLIQMCNLVICDLYYKGYYIHKNLIRRSFINYVLMHIRKNKNKPDIVSLDQEFSKSDNDDVICVKDTIADTQQMYDEEDKDNGEVEQQILNEMREVVIDIIGQRQYDQMLREYGNKQTTAWSRKLMQTIKAKLFELGINAKSFNKYYK